MATRYDFDVSGSKGYENVLWTKYFASGSNVSHFTYDMYVMVDDPTRPQALEFDVNQNFGNNRWVFGTECNFKDHKTWDVWDGKTGWVATKVPCAPATFPANTWTHLVWQFERVGNQVHYVSLTVGTQTYNVDMYQNFEAGWVMQDIDVAFQMDIDSSADPYSVPPSEKQHRPVPSRPSPPASPSPQRSPILKSQIPAVRHDSAPSHR